MTFLKLSQHGSAFTIVLTLATLTLAGLTLLAGLASAAPSQHVYLYTVKFACAPEVGPTDDVELPFEPAWYRTAVNVYNFQSTPVTFHVRAVIARLAPLQQLPPSAPEPISLNAGRATDINCQVIANSLGGGGQPVGSGFVILESREELAVVAVYTAKVMEVQIQNQEAVYFDGPCGGGFTNPNALPLPDPVVVDPDTGPDPPQGSAIEQVRLHIDDTCSDADFRAATGGVGLGVGAGVSVDVEYIEPRRVKRPIASGRR